jgi:large subunit ribosomal protein L22
MTIATALSKYVKISAFKVRRIANEIVGKNVVDAEAYLSAMPNKGALALKKVIHSARTNYMAKNPNTDEEDLIVSKILIDKGSMMKRFHPIGRGRASKILKRNCHIYAEITNKKEGEK